MTADAGSPIVLGMDAVLRPNPTEDLRDPTRGRRAVVRDMLPMVDELIHESQDADLVFVAYLLELARSELTSVARSEGKGSQDVPGMKDETSRVSGTHEAGISGDTGEIKGTLTDPLADLPPETVALVEHMLDHAIEATDAMHRQLRETIDYIRSDD